MYDNKGLSTEIDLTNAAFTNSLTSMQSAFYTASGTTRDFTEITLGSSSDFSNVETLQNTFRNNSSLTLNLPTNLDLTNLTNGSNIATDTIVNSAGYDRFLNRLKATWDTNLVAGTLNFGSSQYTESIVTTGSATSTVAFKLVDTNPGNDFGPSGLNIQVGDIVIDVMNNSAEVTAVDNATTLSLDTDIMVSGEAYEIDNGTPAKDKYWLEDQGWTISDGN